MSNRPFNEQDDDSEQWAEIVRGLGGSDKQAEAPAPLEPGTSESDRSIHTPRPLGPRDYIAPEDPDMEFVPAEPAALGSGNPRLVLSWVAVVASPLALIFFSFIWSPIPTAMLLGLALIFVAGLTSLFFAIPTNRQRHDDPGDNGARL